MNIICAPSSPLPSLAANSIQVMKMAEAFANLGHKTTLIAKSNKELTPAMKDPYAYYGVKKNFKLIKLFNATSKTEILIYGIMISILSYILRADVVYTRCLRIAVIAAYMGHTVIYERHRSFEKISPLLKRRFKKLTHLKNFNALVVISKSLGENLSQTFDIPSDKFILAPSGAEPIQDSITTAPFERKAGRPVVGHIGHLYKGRGTDLIIALAQVLSGVDFHIIGGTPEDIKFWKAQTPDLLNLFFHDYINPSLVPAYMLNCDILIAPYDKNQITIAGGKGNIAQWISPLKIFNYMSSGKPIICSDLAVLHEILEDHKTVLFCPSGDVKAWQAAIQKLCDNPVLAKEIGKNAKEKFLANYTWEKRAEKIISKLQD